MNFKIGNIEIDNPIFLAPMAGITNYAFRKICKEMGAGVVETEMISDNGLKYDNKKTLELLKTYPDESPVIAQIFGGDVETLVNSAKEMCEKGTFDILDINMGCPVNKVIKTGGGSALLKEPKKIYEIITKIKEITDKPVMIKIRAGWDHYSINCAEIARMASLAKVDAITIHGRCRSDLYSGKVNLDFIKMVKDNATCPVIGNGDITSVTDALEMFEKTGVDGVMIGRGALGNPWIFKEIKCYYNNEKFIAPSTDEVLDMIITHANNLIAIKGEKLAMIEMRGHGAWYLKKIRAPRIHRAKISQVTSFKELQNIIEEIKQGVE